MASAAVVRSPSPPARTSVQDPQGPRHLQCAVDPYVGVGGQATGSTQALISCHRPTPGHRRSSRGCTGSVFLPCPSSLPGSGGTSGSRPSVMAEAKELRVLDQAGDLFTVVLDDHRLHLIAQFFRPGAPEVPERRLHPLASPPVSSAARSSSSKPLGRQLRILSRTSMIALWGPASTAPAASADTSRLPRPDRGPAGPSVQR